MSRFRTAMSHPRWPVGCLLALVAFLGLSRAGAGEPPSAAPAARPSATSQRTDVPPPLTEFMGRQIGIL